jgi:hypothetical protein
MPVVIGRAVHLHPIVTIFAVLVGLQVYGILGGLLGVPAAAAINVVFNTLYPRGVQVVEETTGDRVAPGRAPPVGPGPEVPRPEGPAAAPPPAVPPAEPGTPTVPPAPRTPTETTSESSQAFD